MDMKIYSEDGLRNFEFWSGARENALKLTLEQLDEVESMLEDMYPDGISDTQLNDLFWFDFDEVCNWLGISDDEVEEDDEE